MPVVLLTGPPCVPYVSGTFQTPAGGAVTRWPLAVFLVVAAAMSFLELSNPQDEIFALTFNDEVRAVLPPSRPFTDDPETFGANAFARWTGTSFAAPQVTGAIARLAQERGLSARQAYVQLLASGRPLPDFGQTFSILPGV